MTVSDPTTIDRVMGIKDTGRVALIIQVPLTWYHGGSDQLAELVAKVNAYVQFIESGQCLAEYPESASGVDILVVCLDEPTGPAGDLLLQISTALSTKQIGLKYETVLSAENLPK